MIIFELVRIYVSITRRNTHGSLVAEIVHLFQILYRKK